MKKNLIIALAVVAIVVVCAGSYLYYTQYYSPKYEVELEELQTLTVALSSEPRDLDPAIAYDVSSYDIIHYNVFEQLVQYKRGTTDIEPALAKSWEIPDSKTYVFELRDDVTFHDGTPFYADCVKYSFERALQMEAPPSLLLAEIKSVEVLGPYKVQINLEDESAPFLSVLACPVASIVSPTAVAQYGADFNAHPVGTGPFKFESWVTGEIILTANEDYYRGSPRINKVHYLTIPEASRRRALLEQGQVDIVHRIPPGMSPEDIAEVEKNPDIKVYEGVSLRTQFFGINCQKEPFNDKRVRQAIAYAIDYETIIEDVMGGRAVRLCSPVAPTVWGCNKDLPLYQHDVTKAKELLAEAGYPDGFDTTLTYNIEDSQRRDLSIKLRDNLRDVGIEVKIIGLDWPTALTEYYALEQDLFLLGWTPDFVDPDNYLWPMIHSDNMPPNGSDWAGYIDPIVDEMIKEGRITADETARLSSYYEAQARIVEYAPYVYLYAPVGYDCVRADVKGYVFDPLENLRLYELYKE